MEINELYPVIFENCRIVKGAKQSIICDLQRFEYFNIPPEIVELLDLCGKHTVSSIKKKYNNQYDVIIEKNLLFLEDKEIIFFSENPNWFPPMDLSWDSPSQYTNALIDYSEELFENIEKVISSLEKCGCQHVQIRFYEFITIKKLNVLISKFAEKNILSIELLIKYLPEFTNNSLHKLFSNYPRIFSVIIHSCPNGFEEKCKALKQDYFMFSEVELKGETCCGNISPDWFSTNTDFFVESKNHNNCLNRKIGIDKNGLVKNCPSMSNNFGHFKEINFEALRNNKEFTKYWGISKDQVEICKDCEFRYICSDCRAYLEEPENIYSKPLKCGYDPYTNKWEEWSTNPLKEKAIEFYGMQELVKRE